jgi:hypothetical protein
MEELVQIHTRRKNGRASWLDSRIARITGTSAAYVMTGKTVTGSAMKQVFGLSTFEATVQMKIGTTLEPKILTSYCMRHNLTLNTPKGLVLSDKDYIGHTPDGIITYSHREVLEVKVVFSKKSVTSMLHKHIHQLQLGLLVHKCRKGRLLVYVAPSNMTESEATTHVVDLTQLDVGIFQKDDEWINLFTKKSEEFYKDHLVWFYQPHFDNATALTLLHSLIPNDNKPTARSAKKRRLK